ncbi:MAG: M14 family metallopeptidase [Oscillospiraceae bacterium]|nr:M14 family metallopeptidase [Oscillospiraceae bacterium]
MIDAIVSVGLPIDETFEIKKQRLIPACGLKGGEKRLCLVTGTHGDELEGQYVAYELARRIREQPGCLQGIVDIYPALNPLGIDSITRGIPGFDLDMNRIFPGNEEGSMAEFTAGKIVRDLTGADLCVDVHASNIFLKEVVQVRISEQTAEKLVPLAEQLNVDFIWVHGAATVLEATLAHSMNSLGVPTLVVEMGVGMRLTLEYGNQLVDGLLHIMANMGMWTGETKNPKQPIISRDPSQVEFLNAPCSGLFIQRVGHGAQVEEGAMIGEIVNPLTGESQPVTAPCQGMVFTIREYPIVDEGSLLARMLRGQFA